jgi:hypothetical protein
VAKLPVIGDIDIEWFGNCLEFLKPEIALYRVPELSNDPLGRRVAKDIRDCVMKEANSLALCPVQDQILELRIGFDTEAFPEAVWKIGQNGEKLAIFFESYPRFHAWMTCDGLSKISSLRGD